MVEGKRGNAWVPQFQGIPNHGVQLITDFFWLWTFFEAKCLKEDANFRSMERLVDDWVELKKLRRERFSESLEFFRNRYFEDDGFTPRFGHLHFERHGKAIQSLVSRVLSRKEDSKGFSALMVNNIPDVNLAPAMGGYQCFPLYLYDDAEENEGSSFPRFNPLHALGSTTRMSSIRLVKSNMLLHLRTHHCLPLHNQTKACCVFAAGSTNCDIALLRARSTRLAGCRFS